MLLKIFIFTLSKPLAGFYVPSRSIFLLAGLCYYRKQLPSPYDCLIAILELSQVVQLFPPRTIISVEQQN